jgi:MoaA/NifB/PqqE/SkfB family radical SAM enzyme
MYNYSDIRQIHLELSSYCQAKCPMCARNFHGGETNPLLIENDLDLEKFKKIIPKELLSQLNSIYFCGNYGDPLLNNDLLYIVKHICETNPDIRLDIHTNGSLRNIKWWNDLAESLPKNHLVFFGIDGLDDTHSIYRIGTNYKKIIENAKAFINAGGKARWVYLTFKHNEHQLDDAKKIAEELGFESFYEKQTSRFISERTFPVIDKDGKFLYNLEPASTEKVTIIKKETVENYKEILKTAKIECKVKKDKSIYIDVNGYIWPCCYVGAVPYQYSKPNQNINDYIVYNREQLNRVIGYFGDIENFNLNKKTIKEIIDSDEWQTIWENEFKKNSLPVCSRTCGKFEEKIISQSRDQFIELRNFDE